MLLAGSWRDYELIDAGGGEKLERWGAYILRRPDPQAIWPLHDEDGKWGRTDAHYHRDSNGGGRWEYKKRLPKRWTVSYGEVSFYVEPMGFKHTGLFPEQAVNWDWIIDKIRKAKRSVRVLNLFAYTGAASVAAAYAGAEVCHVDAVKGIVARAKENLALSGLSEKPVRFIVDDVVKFVQREIRRDRQYDAVIMDPPSYGHGPKGELWKIEDELFRLVELCTNVLSPDPLFFIINSYTTSLSPSVLKNIFLLTIMKKSGGRAFADEVGLPVSSSGLVLPCGTAGRWEAKP